MPLADGVDLDGLARRTYGFVGADLAALTREAALRPSGASCRKSTSATAASPTRCSIAERPRLRLRQCAEARPALGHARGHGAGPNVSWDDVGGLDAAATKLKEGVELPAQASRAFKRLGIRPAKGFLLYGPPGTGKTLLAKAAARESQANFHRHQVVRPAQQMVWRKRAADRRLFARARQVAPTVIFIDELDSLVPPAAVALANRR
jgi:transitional endoplasmic reticulum ATPase